MAMVNMNSKAGEDTAKQGFFAMWRRWVVASGDSVERFARSTYVFEASAFPHSPKTMSALPSNNTYIFLIFCETRCVSPCSTWSVVSYSIFQSSSFKLKRSSAHRSHFPHPALTPICEQSMKASAL